ncbi:MAG: S-layer homology domain-containing protein [Clostridia bacterium]|nr:S-layer homology domain-containing protein [Clostridia bacterium]
MKKALSLFLSLLIILGGFSAEAAADISALTDGAAAYVSSNVQAPSFGSVGGEWAIFSLARCGREMPEEYFKGYIDRLTGTVKDANGVLHDKKYTEYSRAVIALSSIGADPKNIGGYDLTAPLLDFDKTVWQGINGPVWALIAMQCAGFGDDQIKSTYVDYILSLELPDGGFALTKDNDTPDVDVTAMVLTAFAPYKNNENVSSAIQRGISFLSAVQTSSGGYESFGTENAESAAQVLLCISQLGIPYTDSRFIKNGSTIPDFLTKFQKDGGFSHTADEDAPSLMTTEQCLYSLAAAERLSQNKPSIFDMSDAPKPKKSEGLSGKLDDVSISVIKYEGKTFEDIKGLDCQTAVETLASRGIINGMTDLAFEPSGTMTRAQFATITVSALSLPQKQTNAFADVNTADWFYPYVGTAYSYGIVKGVSETEFNPSGTITREEAAVMLCRAAALCGLDTDMSMYNTLDYLSEFPDYTDISDWAQNDMAFCCREKILDTSVVYINPREAVTRAEIAEMVYKMLGKANLL